MQTWSNDENSVCLSVCPFVRPSVRLSVKRVICDKMEERSIQIFILYERSFSLVFWEEEWLVWSDPFYQKFLVNRPPLKRNRQYSTDIRR